MILLFVLTGLAVGTSVRSIGSSLREIVDVEGPTSAAASEMEINTVEIGQGVLSYLDTGDPRERQQVVNDQADFEKFKALYDELVESREGKELGDQVDRLYTEYEVLGTELMDTRDERGGEYDIPREEQERFLALQDELDKLFDDELQARAAQQLAKAEEAASKEIGDVYWSLLGLIAAGLLVGAGSATLIGRGILRSVRSLKKGADRIGGGDLGYRIAPGSRDELAGVAAAFNSMAERRQEEEQELGRLSRQNKLILDSAGEGIYGLDHSGKATFVNPAASSMLGYETEELIGQPVHALTHHTRPDGTHYPTEECPIYDALRDGVVHRVSDEVFWRKDGTSFPVEYVSTPSSRTGRPWARS